MRNVVFVLFFVFFFNTLPQCSAANNMEEAYNKGYLQISKPLPIEDQKKVEIVEFFSYSCPHCQVLDPGLNLWVNKNKEKISFRRVHVFFGENTAVQQRLYFALEDMNKEALVREKIFDKIHKTKTELDDPKKITPLLAEYGIDEAEFFRFYNSTTVLNKVKEASLFQKTVGIRSIPTLLVDKKFLTRLDFFEAPPNVTSSWWSGFLNRTASAPKEKTYSEIEAMMFSTLDRLVRTQKETREK